MRYEHRLPEIEELEDLLALAIIRLEEDFKCQYKPRPRHHKHHKKYAHRVSVILTAIINQSKFRLMDTKFAANQQQAFQFGLIDQVDSTIQVTGSFTDGSVDTDNEAVAIGTVDDGGNVVFIAKGEGVAKLTAKTKATYTNSLGKSVTEDKVADAVQVTVTKVVTADGVKLVMIAGAISDQPATA